MYHKSQYFITKSTSFWSLASYLINFTKSIPVSFILVSADIVILELIVYISVLLRMLGASMRPIEMHPVVFHGVQVCALFLPLVYAAVGLYPGYGMTGVERLQRRTSSTVLSFGAMTIFDYFAQNGQWSRGILVIAGLLNVLILPVWDEFVVNVLVRAKLWGTPVAIFGPLAQRLLVVEALARRPELGFLPDIHREQPSAIATATLAIVVAEPAGSLPFREFDHLPFRKVLFIPHMEQTQSLWVSVRDLGGLVGLEMRRNLLMPGSQRMKRLLDLIGVIVLTAPVVLLMLIFASLLVLLSPGPVFFTQSRGGRNGQPFRMLKLRTMVPDAEARLQAMLEAEPDARLEWERSMKLSRDPRIVPIIGNIMRRLSIDELPQLWNVLRGEMSLVGPRPLPDYHLATLPPETRCLREQARPGMSGLWQVSGRNELSLSEQHQLDLYYVRNWSTWLDLYILGRTLSVVLLGRGAV